MKTQQILEREMPTKEGVVIIRQNHKTQMFCLSDLGEMAGKPVNQWLRMESTEAFIMHVCDKEELTRDKVIKVYRGTKGTWGHPLLLLDYAMWASPELKYIALKWLQDRLCLLRDEAGDGHKDMCAALYRALPDAGGKDYAMETMMVQRVAGIPKNGRNAISQAKLDYLGRLQKANTNLLNAGVLKRKDRELELIKFSRLLK